MNVGTSVEHFNAPAPPYRPPALPVARRIQIAHTRTGRRGLIVIRHA